MDGKTWPGNVGIFQAEGLRAGGQSALPFLGFEGMVTRPALGLEIGGGDDVPSGIKADFIAVRFAPQSEGGPSPADAADALRKIMMLQAPLLVVGPDDSTEVLKECAVAGFEAGRKLMLGSAREENYKTIAALSMAYGHGVLAQTPMDINLAKQLNILLEETGVRKENVIIDPLSSALGYGLEYTYSTMERIRLNALSGDESMQRPIIGFASNAWETREASERPELGAGWETATAVAMLLAGCDMVVLRDAKSLAAVRDFINRMEGTC